MAKLIYIGGYGRSGSTLLEYRHGAQVPEIFEWLKLRGFAARALTTEHTLMPINPAQLKILQDETRLARRLAGRPHSGYVNNIFFTPNS